MLKKSIQPIRLAFRGQKRRISIFPRKDFTPSEWRQWGIIMGVFAITGSSSVKITRPVVDALTGKEGSWRHGPNIWRLTYLVCTLPIYSTILVSLGTLVGQGPFFVAMTRRMYSRFLPFK
jgi:hypothetical protein